MSNPRHRGTPVLQKAYTPPKQKVAAALLVIPPFSITAAPFAMHEQEPITYHTEQKQKVAPGKEALDTREPMVYSGTTAIALETQVPQVEDHPLVQRAQVAEQKKIDADEATRLEAERIQQEEAQRLEDEERAAQAKKDEEKRLAEEAEIKLQAAQVEVLEEEVEAPDKEDPSNFDITEETQSSDVFAVAEKYIGIPYDWGGTNPETGLDCSGLTQLVYKQLGVNLPRTSGQQAKMGYAVSASEARPGDLVFMGSPVHHVAIYAGNGRIFDARKTGTFIGYGNVWNDHTQYRRVL